MKQYLKLLDHVIQHGEKKQDRTGTGTLSVFGYQNRYDLSKGFPLVTTKKIHLRSVIYELLWFLRGETNIDYLKKNGVTILRPPRDGKMAFIRSPDNISIELLQEGDALPIKEPWASMKNIGSW